MHFEEGYHIRAHTSENTAGSLPCLGSWAEMRHSLFCPVCIPCSTVVSPRHGKGSPRLSFKALRGPKTALVPIQCPPGTPSSLQHTALPYPLLWLPGVQHQQRGLLAIHGQPALVRGPCDTRRTRSVPHFPDSRVPAPLRLAHGFVLSWGHGMPLQRIPPPDTHLRAGPAGPSPGRLRRG